MSDRADGFDGVMRVRYVIRPNASTTWGGRLAWLVALAIPPLLVAVFFATRGAWPVLPFAGTEIAVLAWAFHRCGVQARHREVITMEGDRIRVERGHDGPRERFELALAWTRVVLRAPPSRHRGARVALRAHGREIEIGAWLCEAERRTLAAELARRIELMRSAGCRTGLAAG